MKRKIVSVLTACVVAVTMAVGFFDTAIQATNVADVLPASGVALALGEGVAFEVIDAATSENGVISENESDVAATEYNSEEVTVSENGVESASHMAQVMETVRQSQRLDTHMKEKIMMAQLV